MEADGGRRPLGSAPLISLSQFGTELIVTVSGISNPVVSFVHQQYERPKKIRDEIRQLKYSRLLYNYRGRTGFSGICRPGCIQEWWLIYWSLAAGLLGLIVDPPNNY